MGSLHAWFLRQAAYYRQRSVWDRDGIMGATYWRDMARRMIARARLCRLSQK